MSKIIRVGNSLALTIPSQFVKQTGLRPGDEISVTTSPSQGKITISIQNIRQLALIK